MIVGTAGHIDHGKTSLVKALTGVDADRLPEEKARGITLDLGYAYTPLPNGDVLGFVDVPGHERLIHNMLAGATGIDFVLLIVAADDGPMPQTREHVQIIDLLDLGAGAVALTKIDAVSPARAAEALAETAAALRGTRLENVPLFPVSSITGEGVGALRAHLEHVAGALPPRPDTGFFRLAIDRCFSLKGAGTVVTGTAHSGHIRVGEELVISPPGVSARVRSLHVQDRPAEGGSAGQRCALNLAGAGFDKASVQRGFWALQAPVHAPVQRIDVRLRLLGAEPRSLQHWTPVHVHIGTADVLGRVALLERGTVDPGENVLAQLVLDRPVGALIGDRFIIRDQSAMRTMGGGRVLDPFPPQRGRRTDTRLVLLRAFEKGDVREALRATLHASERGVDLSRFAAAWNLRPSEMDRISIGVQMRRVDNGQTPIAFTLGKWRNLRQALLGELGCEHRRAPDMIGVARERLRRLAVPELAPAAAEAAVDELLHEGLVMRSGPWLHHPDHRVHLSPAEEALWARVRPLIEATPFHPPRVRDLAHALPLEEEATRTLLQRAARLGAVHPVAHDHYFSAGAVAELASIVGELNIGEAKATAASFRDRIGTGRKLAIQILEFFDRVGYTRRIGDRHVLRHPGLFGSQSTSQLPGRV
jgi:selenocysteine-specific elongation factor